MLLLTVLMLAAVCASAQTPLDRAVTLARQQRYAEARTALEGVAEPAGVQQQIAFHRLQAAIASGLEEASNAADQMNRALALAPSDQGLSLATAAAELQAGRLDEALRHAAAGGGSAVAQALIGDIREKRGEYVEAANAYQAAVALAPDREQYRIALALELVEHYTFEPAIAVLEQSSELFPKSARVRTLLAVARYAMGQVDQAQAALLEAIAIDPKLEPAYDYLARFAMESNAAPSRQVSRALCGWDKTVCAALKLRTARESDDKALALQAIAELKQAPEGNPTASCELGKAYEWLERWGEARQGLEACVKLDGSAQNHYRLGRVYARLGLPDLASEQMRLRNEASARSSEEVARRESAVQAFQYLVK